MEKKEIQEQRVRGYFIDATKQMIKGEGINSISARAVADYAGYSYATLYNYFKDLKELIFICVDDFIEEIKKYVQDTAKKSDITTECIISKTVAYTNYFVQYNGIYDLLFLEKMPEFAFSQGLSNQICNLITDLTAEEWQALKSEKNWDDKQLIEKQEMFKLYLAGSMLYYLNRRIPSDYVEFLNTLKSRLFVNID